MHCSSYFYHHKQVIEEKKMKTKWQMLFAVIVIVCLIGTSSTAWGQIAAWETSGLAGSETSFNATTNDANLNTSTLIRGTGITATSLANAFNSKAFQTGTTDLTTATTHGDYLQFTINAKTGYQVSLTTLDANFRRSSTGPNSFQWQYSLDGFTTAEINIGSKISYTLAPTNGDAQTQISLSGISALQGVTSGTTITIRLYCWGATGAAGSFAIGLLSGNDLAIGGSLEVALPVEMTSFTASMQSGSCAILKWSTATEVNNSGFEIQRRAENTTAWAKVSFVSGAGTSNSPKEYTYQDVNLAPGVYVYRIKQIDNNGAFKYSASTQVDAGVAGKSFELLRNYPNPFNPTTNMQFSVPQDGYASLKVYNMLGQEVATLFDGMAQAGHYISATFDGSRFASGVYFSRLQYNGKSLVQRMLMTK
jgi:hypothetical protein